MLALGGWVGAGGVHDPKRVVVLGGGIGGLATALALESSGRKVVIVEREPEPPELAPEQAYDAWERAGVPQFRHAHIFLARLHTVIRDHHPALLAELLQAGITRSEVDQMLPPSHVASYEAAPGDEDLRHLWGRRATLEYVLRRHVGRLPHVRFVHGARVEELIATREGGALRVTGVEAVRDGMRERFEGAAVVDASGARTRAGEWLAARGAKIETERHESPYAYFCRHYVLRDPSSEPPRRGTGANLDYLWYGLFCAEHGRFSIAMACPDEERELIELMRRPAGFDWLCGRLSGLGPWLRDAEPTSKVLGAGNLANRWTRYGAKGGPEVLGYFPVGDSHVQTNPMYGRGCSFAFVQAQALAAALASDADPRRQAAHYLAHTRALLKPHYDASIGADRLFLSRAHAQRGQPVPAGQRLINHLYDEAWTPALNDSQFVARELLKAMEMRDLSPVGTRLAVLARIVWAWIAGRFRRARAAAPALGPSRSELLRALPAGGDQSAP
jgi:2-polyprenyl-6-methoxyphenol hydroxylase-like FAD-dependent oxidoreductase